MSPELVVTVEVAVRRASQVHRSRIVHALRGSVVETAAVDEDGMSSGRTHLAAWHPELTRLAAVAVPGDAPLPPADAPDLPWDLVVAGGQALTERRPEVYDELVARADDRTRHQLQRLHRSTVGRLRAVGVVPARRRVGWVSWVLVADGWRALTPYVAAGTAMVRLERRRPDDLATEVARWAALGGAGAMRHPTTFFSSAPLSRRTTQRGPR